ncbi:MAG: cation transporter, partial [Erysipelotrichaceae bacterium]
MQQSYKIIGMTCAACAQKIEKVTSKLNGVTSSSVNFATEKLLLNYDETIFIPQDIHTVVAKAGYEILVDMVEKDIVIPIS